MKLYRLDKRRKVAHIPGNSGDAMAKLNPLAAEVLEASVAGYATAATLVHEEALERDGLGEAFSRAEWAEHFKQRILELAAAIRVNQPSLFAGRVTWLRRAFEARGTDVATLKRAVASLRAALQQEFPENLRDAVVGPLENALETFNADLPPESTYLDADSETGKIGLEYIAACLAGEPQRAVDLVLAAVENGLAPSNAYSRVLIPAQKEVGQYWHVGEISVAEERVISETTLRLLSLISHLHGSTEAAEGPVVIHASVRGNAHDLGLRVIGELFRLAGWKSLMLGANVPAAEIARAVAMFAADLVVLNATLATQLKELRETIALIKQTRPKTAVLVGGLALDETPDLWREFGADGYAADIDEAVALGSKLVSS